MSVELANREIELDAREIRVLGCLIEKELSTPDYYPMTVNALTSACNQKTNREPVVEYDEGDVQEVIERLQRKRMVGTASSSHGRVTKYRHALAEMMGLEPRHLAVLATIMLRGPETAGEIRGRTNRMHDFDSLEEVDGVLEELSSREPPLVQQMPRRPGQKEARYAHLFGDVPDEPTHAVPAAEHGLPERVDELEEEIAALKASLSDLSEAFRNFKKQFE